MATSKNGWERGFEASSRGVFARSSKACRSSLPSRQSREDGRTLTTQGSSLRPPVTGREQFSGNAGSLGAADAAVHAGLAAEGVLAEDAHGTDAVGGRLRLGRGQRLRFSR